MCAIIDANVAGEVFAEHRSTPAEQFFDWLQRPDARLAVGGKLLEELSGNGNFVRWAQVGIADGRVRTFPREALESETATVCATRLCESDDAHIIALARVSQARLLYSHDRNLHGDFRNRNLISNPRGRVYPRGDSDNATRKRRRLLSRNNLCPNR